MMEVKTTAEEVTVVQKAPLVSTTKPNVTEEFDSRLRRGPAPPRPRQHPPRHAGHRWPARSATACAAAAPTRPWSPRTASTWAPPGKTISPSFKSSAAFEIQTAGYGADNPTAAGRHAEPGDPLGLEPVRVRVQRHRRRQPAALLPRPARHPRRTPSTTCSTRPSPGRSSRTSSGTSSTPRPTSPRTAGSATSRAIFPDPVPTQRIIQKGIDQADLAGHHPQQAVRHHATTSCPSSTTASTAWASMPDGPGRPAAPSASSWG